MICKNYGIFLAAGMFVIIAVTQVQAAGKRQTGTIKTFSPHKGFGYIAPDKPGPDLFMHFKSMVPGTPANEGQRVSFDTESTPRGLVASGVQALESLV